MRIRSDSPYIRGYNSITEMNGNYKSALMDFGLFLLESGDKIVNEEPLERAYLLMKGSVIFNYNGKSIKAERSNPFNVSCVCLHIPKGVKVEIICTSKQAELVYQATTNNNEFEPVFYSSEDVASEMRGKGTMGDTSTRNVRTIFDNSNAPYANLVLGEVIDYPGKWSSYPPHHHPQPEIYFYKFNPVNGYGFCELGEDVVKVRENDAVLIPAGATHPQTTAPGYAMLYVWVIRHLENDRYITPTFVEEHTWVNDSNAKIWGSEK